MKVKFCIEWQRKESKWNRVSRHTVHDRGRGVEKVGKNNYDFPQQFIDCIHPQL